MPRRERGGGGSDRGGDRGDRPPPPRNNHPRARNGDDGIVIPDNFEAGKPLAYYFR